MNEINSITIVGGGSSGWMTAATLIRFFPNKKITIIEPENIPTIGVGESTLGSINNWLNFIGIKKEDFMKESDASYKLSIKFKGFYHENDEAFHYPFGFPMFEILDDFGGPEEWHLLKSLNKKLSITDYVNCFYSSSSLINNNKYSENLNNQFENYNPDVDSAVHFDAIKFANWLKNNICLPEGVSLINSHVVDVSVNELGIEKIILSNGDIIESDLFIDCTGFKSILLSSVGDNKFIDYSDIIPNNSAWAARVPYSNKEKELEPYTTCTALKNGWAWNIPLWSRIGTGYVYSNKFISKENSLKEFKEYLSNKFLIDPEVLDFNHIDFKVGIYEKTWIGNVVAIGLSAGFIEPLESNGLFTVHEFLLKLCNVLERDRISQWDIDTYNTITFMQYNDFAQFVAMHYALSTRNDSDYWKTINNKIFFKEIINHEFTNKTSPLDLIIRKFYINNWGRVGYAGGGSAGLHCIATGMQYSIFPKTYLLNRNKNIDIKEKSEYYNNKWKSYKEKWNRLALDEPSLYEYLKDRIYNND